MNRFTRWAPTLLVLLTIPGRPAAAQFNVIGPGSTVAGDTLRGEGAAAFGWGASAQGWGAGYHLFAVGQSVEADTMLRLQAAQARDDEAYLIRRQSRIEARKARDRANAMAK